MMRDPFGRDGQAGVPCDCNEWQQDESDEAGAKLKLRVLLRSGRAQKTNRQKGHHHRPDDGQREQTSTTDVVHVPYVAATLVSPIHPAVWSQR